MNISAYIPAAFRKPLYGAFAVIGLTIGAFQIGIASVSGAEPEWLTIAVNVFPFVATAIGFTAASNTTAAVYTEEEFHVAEDCDVDDSKTSTDEETV